MTSLPKVLVVGDVMLDRRISGTADRLSPEAPVPIVSAGEEDVSFALGGAANVAANVNGLGGNAVLIGLAGPEKDVATKQLRNLLEKHNVIDGLVYCGPRTTLKTRIYANNQVITRIDDEEPYSNDDALISKLNSILTEHKPDIVALVDYNKGVFFGSLARRLILESCLPIVADPKKGYLDRFGGATILKPNLAALEAENELLNRSALEWKALALCNQLSVANMVVTMGGSGMLLVHGKLRNAEFVPAWEPKLIRDVTGAGDTVTAALAVAIGQGKPIREASYFASAAAGVVVGKPGTAVAELSELKQLSSKQPAPIFDNLGDLQKWAKQRLIVMANGCFDVIHSGHLSMLNFAANRVINSSLLVAVDNDERIRKLKGSHRPVVPCEARCRILAEMSAVAAVVAFGDRPQTFNLPDVIEAAGPVVMVKGDEYKGKQIEGEETIKRWGGRLELAPMLEAFRWSSSKLVGNYLDEIFKSKGGN